MKNQEELLLELVSGQSRIEQKIDSLVKHFDEHRTEDTKKFEAQGARIGSLEASRYWIYGMAASVSAAVGLFADKVIAKVFP